MSFELLSGKHVKVLEFLAKCGGRVRRSIVLSATGTSRKNMWELWKWDYVKGSPLPPPIRFGAFGHDLEIEITQRGKDYLSLIDED